MRLAGWASAIFATSRTHAVVQSLKVVEPRWPGGWIGNGGRCSQCVRLIFAVLP